MYLRFQAITMRRQKVFSGEAVGVPATETAVAMVKLAVVLRAAQPHQGKTSWRDRAQLRMTLFTSRDGWDSSVGWL